MTPTASAERTRPRLVGDGPATCSSCTVLAVQPGWVADANGYYRELGVDPKATRQEIRSAHLARGQDNARLTFVTKQLLDPVVRRAYDLAPLGSVFIDRYVVAALQRSLKRARAVGALSGATRQEEPAVLVLDTIVSVTQADPAPPGWHFAYYLWDTDSRDTARLAEWQELLVREFAQHDLHHQFSVGLHGGDVPATTVRKVGRRIVVFLREDEPPTQRLAQQAVLHLTQLRPT